jgi:hypothetical protein
MIEDDDLIVCDVCGSTGDDGEGCPFCLPCSGMYAPGSEECDFCNYQYECSNRQ